MTTRTQELMVKTPIKAQQVALESLSADARATRPGFIWSLDMERAKLVTQSYRQTEGQPVALRRARAAYLLDHLLTASSVMMAPCRKSFFLTKSMPLMVSAMYSSSSFFRRSLASSRMPFSPMESILS